ncbi:PKD domain-containing protein [Chloroflexota bacterium]
MRKKGRALLNYPAIALLLIASILVSVVLPIGVSMAGGISTFSESTPPAGLEVQSADAEYYASLVTVGIPTQTATLDDVFISHSDSTVSNNLIGVNIPTIIAQLSGIFISHDDSKTQDTLSAAGISTASTPVDEIFISHADATLTKTMSTPAVGTLQTPITGIFISHADATFTHSLSPPGLMQPPNANAGADQTVKDGASVTLDGSGSSDSNGTVVAYKWSEGATVLSSSASFSQVFAIGDHTITLQVTDDDGLTDTDTVLVKVNPKQSPVADAGTDKVAKDGSSVTLDASGSIDSDGTIVAYKWTEGATVLNNSSSFSQVFAIGEHTITLEVTDDDGLTGTDTVLVKVNPKQPPVADAGGNQNVKDGTAASLNASGSYDTDGTIVSYKWSEGGTVLSNSISFNKVFALGDHTLTLEITDDDGLTGTDTVLIKVQPNQSPVAEAGANQTVKEGSKVTLDGSGSSDTDGTIASYKWWEGAILLSNNLSFDRAFAIGIHTVTLEVTDEDGATGTDTVLITVNANQPPIADAGLDQTVSERATTTVDGSSSNDPDGTIVAYEWKEGDTVISNEVSFTKVFTFGEHSLILKVTDDNGATALGTVLITSVGEPLVTLEKKAAADTVRLGHEVEIEIIASNNGNGSGLITIEDPLPTDFEIASGVNYWQGNLAAGGSLTLTYKLKPVKVGEFQLQEATANYEDSRHVKYTEKSNDLTVEVLEPSFEPSSGEQGAIVNPDTTQISPDPGQISINVRADKTELKVGESTVLYLSAVNGVASPAARLQLILKAPSGVSITATEFVEAGGGLYTSSFSLEPEQARHIEITIQANQSGNCTVEGQLNWYFGDETDDVVSRIITLPLNVEGEDGGDGGPDGDGGGEAGSCSCNSASMNVSARELVIGWGIIGLCWGGGYYLVRKTGRRKSK